MRSVLVGVLAAVGMSLITVNPARADRLCDPSFEDCRAILLNLIQNEHTGIDVAFWFMEDARYSAELVRRAQAGVRVRVLVDLSANAAHPVNALIINQLKDAGIQIRRRNVSSILHWKMMLFAGQGQVEFSGANFSPDAFVPNDPYRNCIDEAILFTGDAAIVQSFARRFEDLWTDTKSFVDHANVTSRTRHYPEYPISPEMSFSPLDSYRTRSVNAYAAERTGIDAIMYRITDRAHTDAVIEAVNRGVKVRIITEQLEYRNPNRLWDAWNVDRLWMAGVQIRQRAHLGLVHQKSVILHGQGMTIFGSSNWTTPSNQAQEEHNIFTTRAWMYDWFKTQFERKWNNTGGAPETELFRPLPPGQPIYSEPANGATGVSTKPTIAFNAGPYAHLYDVYVGTTPNPPLIAVNVPLGPTENGVSPRWELPALAPGTTYYWRVVSRTMANLTATSDIRSFTTVGSAPPNVPPSITLTSPTAGATFTAPAVVAFSANASDVDGTITRVEFLANGNVVATALEAPFTATWTNVPAGTYVITARAWDNRSEVRLSMTATITVTAAVQPPVVTPPVVTPPGGTPTQPPTVTPPGGRTRVKTRAPTTRATETGRSAVPRH